MSTRIGTFLGNLGGVVFKTNAIFVRSVKVLIIRINEHATFQVKSSAVLVPKPITVIILGILVSLIILFEGHLMHFLVQ